MKNIFWPILIAPRLAAKNGRWADAPPEVKMRDILDRIRKACRDCIIYEDGSEPSKLAYSRLNEAIKDYHAAQQSAQRTACPECGAKDAIYINGVHEYKCSNCGTSR
jgi:hypothetical protein